MGIYSGKPFEVSLARSFDNIFQPANISWHFRDDADQQRDDRASGPDQDRLYAFYPRKDFLELNVNRRLELCDARLQIINPFVGFRYRSRHRDPLDC
jgi:hypothetical protein